MRPAAWAILALILAVIVCLSMVGAEAQKTW